VAAPALVDAARPGSRWSLAQETLRATERCHAVSLADSASVLDHQRLAQTLAQDGRNLPPMLDQIENSEFAVDDFIDVMGQATIEAVQMMSTARLA
jgi:hypothetical protein